MHNKTSKFTKELRDNNKYGPKKMNFDGFPRKR